MKTSFLVFILAFSVFAVAADSQPDCSNPYATDVGMTEDCNATFPHTPLLEYPAVSTKIIEDTCENSTGHKYFQATSTAHASGFCAYSRDQPNTARVCAGVYELEVIKAAISTDHNQFYNRGFDQIMNTNNGPSSLWPCERSGGFHTDYKQCIGVACPSSGGGIGGGGGGCIAAGLKSAVCQTKGRCCQPSPIIIDTTGTGFKLTNATTGVLFDIAGNGQPIQMGWTQATSGNAFLALDRNGNGKIDNGQELFGNFSPQAPCANDNLNGFRALMVYDQPEAGGNKDGIIDRNDAIFPHLLLWIDANHDGVSQPGELHSLAEFGITSINLKYKQTALKDQYGNWFRFFGTISSSDPVKRQIYDVVFTMQ